MTTQTKPRPAIGLESTGLEPRRFTIAEYFAMAEAGILTEADRVELIDGVIVAMSPIGNPHIASVDKLTRLMGEAVGRRAILRVQSPVTLDEYTMPEPDLVILRERSDFYAHEAAGPEDVLLLIEVSDSSLSYDRNAKLALYARFGIPEVWITALPERIMEAHTKPAAGSYTRKQTLSPGDTITPECFPDITIPVAEIIPA